jgi:hypothetical protein
MVANGLLGLTSKPAGENGLKTKVKLCGRFAQGPPQIRDRHTGPTTFPCPKNSDSKNGVRSPEPPLWPLMALGSALRPSTEEEDMGRARGCAMEGPFQSEAISQDKSERSNGQQEQITHDGHC